MNISQYSLTPIEVKFLIRVRDGTSKSMTNTYELDAAKKRLKNKELVTYSKEYVAWLLTEKGKEVAAKL